ncbi:hypothetical protein [Kitasatospora sp. NPDC050543]|uniref:hypothetical protein n=1 Tax=Kitasatospora sp. NPDC050543 TaxID=3364054 RepID=UPI0037B660EB
MTAGGATAGGARAGGGPTAHVLLLCALLAGLFLMHGAPTSAAGCHAVTRTAHAAGDRATVELPAGGQHAHAVQRAHAAPAARAHRLMPGARSADTVRTPADRALCVSTKAGGGVLLSAPGQVAGGLLALLLLAIAAGPALRPADSPRAPPRAGRLLLLKVCVART